MEQMVPEETVFIQRKSFYQRLRTFKYACIIQLLTTFSLFFFLLIDTIFKIIQSKSNIILATMIENMDHHLLHNCSTSHNITIAKAGAD